MKKIIKYLLLYSILMICYYCSPKEKINDENIIYCDNLEEIDAIKYCDINYFDSCYFIKLETHADALIASIAQLETFKDKIYIWDKSAQKVMCFGNEGEFQGTIGKRGRAPNEYVSLSGFFINTWDSTINLFDPVNMCIKTYDMEGSYIKEVKHKNEDLCFVGKCTMLDSTKIFCYHSTNWKNNNMFSIIDIHDYDHPLEVIKYPYTSSDFFSYNFSNQPYVVQDEKILYNKLFSNILYQNNNGISEPYWVIKNKREIDERLLNLRLAEVKGDYYKVRQDLIRENVYNVGFLNLFENKRFILVDFMTDRSIVKALLWDKIMHKGVQIENYSSYNPDLKLFKSINNNSVICIWDRSAILAFRNNLDETTMKSYPSDLIEAAVNFNMEEDNPMLIVFTFKEEI